MSHLAATAMLDLRLQARNKLFAIGFGVALSTGLVARVLLAVTAVAVLLPGIWLGAIGTTTFMFVAGMVLFEKGERTLDALIVTPLPVRTYLFSKVLKLVSGVSMLPMAAYFIEGPLHYLFGVFPPFWIFKAWWVAVDGGSTWWVYALVGVLTNLILLGWMKSRFERVVHRGNASVVRATPSPAPASS